MNTDKHNNTSNEVEVENCKGNYIMQVNKSFQYPCSTKSKIYQQTFQWGFYWTNKPYAACR